MLSSLRAKMDNVHAVNIFEFIVELKVWIVTLDSHLGSLNRYGSLQSALARLALSNLTFKLEVDAFSAVAMEKWPSDLNERIIYFKTDLANTQEVLEECLLILTAMSGSHAHIMKISLERLLS